MTRRRRILLRALLAATAPILLLVLAESVLAVAGLRVPRYRFLREVDAYWVPDGANPPGYVRAIPRLRPTYPEATPLFLARKPPGGLRVFVLGESTVEGSPYETGAFCDWLRVRLPALLPDRAVEVVNAGNGGWCSAEIEMLLRECLEHEADVVVWATGHNEFTMRSLSLAQERSAFGSARALLRLAGSSRTVEAVRRLLPASLLRAGAAYDRSLLPDRTVYGDLLPALRDQLRETLDRVVADCEAAGARLLLCTMPRNVRECPPTWSVFRPEVFRDADRLRAWESAYDEATGALVEGRPADALGALDRAAAVDESPARLSFARGRALEALGRQEEANRAFLLALERDACPLRAMDWAEESIRDVARLGRVPLVDLQRLFDSRSPKGLAGLELLCDQVHPSLRGHELVAQTILESLERELGLPLRWTAEPPREEARRVLHLDEYEAKGAPRGEFASRVAVAVLTGSLDASWTSLLEESKRLVAESPNDGLLLAQAGFLSILAGQKARGSLWIDQAMERGDEIRSYLLLLYRTEPPVRRLLDRIAFDPAAVEARLSEDARRALARSVGR